MAGYRFSPQTDAARNVVYLTQRGHAEREDPLPRRARLQPGEAERVLADETGG